MALSSLTKDEINESCREIVNDPVREDYSRDKAAVERVVASLHDDGSRFGGWVIEGWANFRSQARKDPPLVNWTTGKRLQLRRRHQVRLTRHAAHQQLAEDRGEVAAGDNTYVSGDGRSLQGDVGDFHDASNRVDTYGTVFDIAIGLCQRAMQEGKRPIDRTGAGET